MYNHHHKLRRKYTSKTLNEPDEALCCPLFRGWFDILSLLVLSYYFYNVDVKYYFALSLVYLSHIFSGIFHLCYFENYKMERIIRNIDILFINMHICGIYLFKRELNLLYFIYMFCICIIHFYVYRVDNYMISKGVIIINFIILVIFTACNRTILSYTFALCGMLSYQLGHRYGFLNNKYFSFHELFHFFVFMSNILLCQNLIDK